MIFSHTKIVCSKNWLGIGNSVISGQCLCALILLEKKCIILMFIQWLLTDNYWKERRDLSPQMVLKNLVNRKSFLSFDLKTGGTIIGYIHLIVLILNILRLFYVLYEWGLSIWPELIVSGMLFIQCINSFYNMSIWNHNSTHSSYSDPFGCDCELVVWN